MSETIYAVYGASGFGREVMPLVRERFQNDSMAKFIFIDDDMTEEVVNNYMVCSFNDFLKIEANEKFATLAIANSKTREILFNKLENNGIKHLSIVSKNALILDSVDTAENLILTPFTTLTSNIQIGKAFHANIYSYVAHDCVIGDFVTFAPGVKCNGNVHIQNHVYIGTGAIIKQGKPQKPIDQVACELDQKMHDEKWLKQASQAAIKLAEDSFHRDVLAKQLLAVLEATLQGQPDKAEIIAPGIYA